MCVSFQAALVMKAAKSSMLGAGMANNKVKYSRLAADDDGYIDLQVRRLFFSFSKSMNPNCGVCLVISQFEVIGCEVNSN